MTSMGLGELEGAQAAPAAGGTNFRVATGVLKPPEGDGSGRRRGQVGDITLRTKYEVGSIIFLRQSRLSALQSNSNGDGTAVFLLEAERGMRRSKRTQSPNTSRSIKICLVSMAGSMTCNPIS